MKYLVLTLITPVLPAAHNSMGQPLPQLPVVKLSDFADAKPAQSQFRIAELDGIQQSTPADGVVSGIACLADGDTVVRFVHLSERRRHSCQDGEM